MTRFTVCFALSLAVLTFVSVQPGSFLGAFLGSFPGGAPEAAVPSEQVVSLGSVENLTLVGVKAEVVTYKGSKALRVTEGADFKAAGRGSALIKNTDFSNGVIEVDVAGAPAPGAFGDARGFVGISFRSVADGSKYECFYIRPTNGRADDQLRRNHSTQYESEPDYPWFRLRKENPGVYESYVDLETGAWTRLRIVVEGTRAKLYVNNADQPALIVNDLKLGESHGQIGLWIGPGTEAYFSNLKITSSQPVGAK